MYSLLVSVSTFDVSPFVKNQNIATEQISIKSNWVSIKWFHDTDYETQTELNDAAEVFADGIIKDLDFYHFLKIEKVQAIKKEKGGFDYSFETVKLMQRLIGQPPSIEFNILEKE